jgi:hypothetical protein
MFDNSFSTGAVPTRQQLQDVCSVTALTKASAALLPTLLPLQCMCTPNAGYSQPPKHAVCQHCGCWAGELRGTLTYTVAPAVHVRPIAVKALTTGITLAH